jgi:hypothetical protein
MNVSLPNTYRLPFIPWMQDVRPVYSSDNVCISFVAISFSLNKSQILQENRLRKSYYVWEARLALSGKWAFRVLVGFLLYQFVRTDFVEPPTRGFTVRAIGEALRAG